MGYWRKDGKLIIDKDGKAISCSKCPCTAEEICWEVTVAGAKDALIPCGVAKDGVYAVCTPLDSYYSGWRTAQPFAADNDFDFYFAVGTYHFQLGILLVERDGCYMNFLTWDSFCLGDKGESDAERDEQGKVVKIFLRYPDLEWVGDHLLITGWTTYATAVAKPKSQLS